MAKRWLASAVKPLKNTDPPDPGEIVNSGVGMPVSVLTLEMALPIAMYRWLSGPMVNPPG